MTFDKLCRDLFMEICERHDLYVDRDPTYGGRTYLEKQEYIIMTQRQKLAELEAELEAKTLKIQDVDAMADNAITMRKNGTTFTVVVKSAEKAKLTFEELMRKLIEEEAVSLESLENTEVVGIGSADEEGK